MGEKDPFEILKLERTYDTGEIKKAYANLVKECHPEDDPNAWRILHEAYKSALAFAGGKGLEEVRLPDEHIVVSVLPEKKKAKTKAKRNKEGEELENLIGQIGQRRICQKKPLSEKEKKAFSMLRVYLKELEDKKEKKYEDWLYLFQSESYQVIRFHETFLWELGRVIGSAKLDSGSERLISQEFIFIRNRLSGNLLDEEAASEAEVVQYLERQIRKAGTGKYLQVKLSEKKDKQKNSIGIIILVCLLASILPLVLIMCIPVIGPALEAFIRFAEIFL